MSSYLLIQTEAGGAREAARSLRALVGKDAVDIVQGPFDLVARAEDEETEAQILRRCAEPPFIRALPCRVQAREQL